MSIPFKFRITGFHLFESVVSYLGTIVRQQTTNKLTPYTPTRKAPSRFWSPDAFHFQPPTRRLQ